MFTSAFTKIGNIFIQGEDVHLHLQFPFLKRNQIGYQLSVEVFDFWGQKVLAQTDIPLSSGDRGLTVDISFKLETVGWFRVGLSLQKDHKNIPLINKGLAGEESFLTFAVLSKFENHPQDSPFGVCVHSLSEDTARLINLGGISWIRTDVFWDNIQPDRNSYRWERLDQILHLAEQNNLRVLPIIDYGVPWASTAPARASDFEKTRYQPKTFAYENFVERLVERYKGSIHFWEIWNEPNIDFWKSPKEEYAGFLKGSYEAIRKVDPDALVLMGGLAGAPVDWLKTLSQNQAGEAFDIYNIHPYHFPDAPEPRLPRELIAFKAAADGRGAKPLWITEIGAPTNMVTLEEQASFLVRDAVLALANGVTKFFWYELADDHINSKDREANFGILFYDLSPKPAYVAYANLIRLLDGQKFKSKINFGSSTAYGFVFAGEPGDILILWTTQKREEIKLPVPASSIKRVDLMGQEETLEIGNNELMLTLTGNPVYLLPQRKP